MQRKFICYGLQKDLEAQNGTQEVEASAITINNNKNRIIPFPSASTSTATNMSTKNNNKNHRAHKRSLPSNQSEVTINRLQLFATVKILLKFLAKEKPHLRFVAQKVLKDCHKQHQNDKSSSLAELIERRLRETVGEKLWRMARTIQQRQCSISLKSIDQKSKRSEFIVRGKNNNMITLIVPLASNNASTAISRLEQKKTH